MLLEAERAAAPRVVFGLHPCDLHAVRTLDGEPLFPDVVLDAPQVAAEEAPSEPAPVVEGDLPVMLQMYSMNSSGSSM